MGIAAANAPTVTPKNSRTNTNPETFTPGPFNLEVHDNHPIAHLDGIDEEQVGVFAEMDPSTVLMIRPFENDLKIPEQHRILAGRAAKAIELLTGYPNAKVVGPIPSKDALSSGETPKSMFVHNLDEATSRALQARRFIISKEITFEVLTIERNHPHFIFILTNLNGASEDEVAELVRNTHLSEEGLEVGKPAPTPYKPTKKK